MHKIKDYNIKVTHLDQLIMLEAWDIDTLIFE